MSKYDGVKPEDCTRPISVLVTFPCGCEKRYPMVVPPWFSRTDIEEVTKKQAENIAAHARHRWENGHGND